MADHDRKDWMRREVLRGRMSRRDFIQLSLAAGLSAAAADGAFAAATASGPRKGGTFKMAVAHGAPRDTFDPATWVDLFMADAGQIVGNCLVSVDQRNTLQPDLAEAFEPSDGAKTWMFRLKKGITFHNGKTLSADDVIANIGYHRDPKTRSPLQAELADIAELKSDGDDKVLVTLKSANADFPYVLSDYHLPIFAAKDGKIDFASGIGTGPYVLDKFEPGAKLTAHRNPNYHHSDAAWFDGVELHSMPDYSVREAALTGGQVHYADRIDPRSIPPLKRRKDMRITEVAGFGHYVAPMNCSVKPFDNNSVRQALKYAINRDELVKRVLSGYGIPGDDVPLAPSLKYATQPEPKYHYDPEQAKSLLKTAGITDLKLDLSVSEAAFPGATDAAQLIKASAKKAGIEINVVKEAADSYWDVVWMKRPWCLSYWSGRPTANGMFSTAYAADANWNDSYWKNARFNELLVSARAETDDKKRFEMYSEMQQIVHDDGGVAVLMFNSYLSAHSAKVAHGDLNSNTDHDGGQIFQRWWMA
jgi:peptide/nickel transport system substrate-binding protein